MPHEPKTITIDEASDLARLLSEANTRPLRLTAGAVSYRVTREDTLAQTNPAAFNATIDRLAGSWTAEDAEAAIEYIYKARAEGSRPATRP
jgi:hypothetical protein